MTDDNADGEAKLGRRINRYVDAGVASLPVPAPRFSARPASRLLARAMGASALGLIAALLFVARPAGPDGTTGGPQGPGPTSTRTGVSIASHPVSPHPTDRPAGGSASALATPTPELACEDQDGIVDISEDGGATWDGGATPEEAVAAFLSEVDEIIPRSGFEPAGRGVASVTFAHLDDGIVRAVVRVDQGTWIHADERWLVVRARSCAASEFGLDTDFGRDRTAWWSTEEGLLLERAGAEHCGWQTVRTLTLDGRQYVRDPEGVVLNWPLAGRYDPSTVLPADASSTGYDRGEKSLWLSADRRFLFVVDEAAVERWPASASPLLCR